MPRESTRTAVPRSQIDALFAEWDRPDSPGAALAVVRNGKVAYKKGYGTANLEYGIPIKPSSIFHIASVSKQFTTFSAMLLEKRGALSLDDDVRKHVAEVPDFGQKVTLRHLVHHVSGMRDQWELLRLSGVRLDDVIETDHILKLVARQRDLNFPPGSEYLYCNTGYTLLAETVARVSGKSFAEFTHDEIFSPLDMRRTHFHDQHEALVKNRTYSYKRVPSGGIRKAVLSYANVGATSLFTTVEDLAKWSLNFETGRVGGRSLLKAMHEPFTLSDGEKIAYAGGLVIGRWCGLRTVEHGGSDAGYRTHFLRFPDQRCTIIVLSNLADFVPVARAREVARLVLEGDIPAMSDYEGAYYSAELDTHYRIRSEEGDLVVQHTRRGDERFSLVDEDRFKHVDGNARCEFERRGRRVTGFKLTTGRVRNLRFVRVKDPA